MSAGKLNKPGGERHLVVRIATPEDRVLAAAAEELVARAANGADMARRERALLQTKIENGQAVVALGDGELIGFGYFSSWQDGTRVSHSGLVVREEFRGRGIGRRLKEALLDASRRLFPQASIISLTTSKAVEALNRSLGFQPVPLSQLTDDPGFWKGCETCRNYEEVRRQGKKCCCIGMILRTQTP